MKMERAIVLFLDCCRSKELRPKTMHSCEQALCLLNAVFQVKGSGYQENADFFRSGLVLFFGKGFK